MSVRFAACTDFGIKWFACLTLTAWMACEKVRPMVAACAWPTFAVWVMSSEWLQFRNLFAACCFSKRSGVYFGFPFCRPVIMLKATWKEKVGFAAFFWHCDDHRVVVLTCRQLVLQAAGMAFGWLDSFLFGLWPGPSNLAGQWCFHHLSALHMADRRFLALRALGMSQGRACLPKA